MAVILERESTFLGYRSSDRLLPMGAVHPYRRSAHVLLSVHLVALAQLAKR